MVSTTNQTKINELKIIPSYNYELIRPSKDIINLANLELCLNVYLRKLNLLQMQKVCLLIKGVGVQKNLLIKG